MGAVVQTADTEMLEALQRIADAQLVMAIVMVLIGMLALGAAVLVLLELRSARMLMRGMLSTVNDLKPRLAPLIDQVKNVTDDVAGMTGDARRRMDAILHTVEDLHRAVQQAADAAEARLRRFNSVLDVVQTETEDLLLDAAATAHGVQEAARTLRGPDPRGGRRTVVRLDDADDEEDST